MKLNGAAVGTTHHRFGCVVRCYGFDRADSMNFFQSMGPMTVRRELGFKRKREGFMVGQVRKDELLAKAFVIDGMKEWLRKTNMWT